MLQNHCCCAKHCADEFLGMLPAQSNRREKPRTSDFNSLELMNSCTWMKPCKHPSTQTENGLIYPYAKAPYPVVGSQDFGTLSACPQLQGTFSWVDSRGSPRNSHNFVGPLIKPLAPSPPPPHFKQNIQRNPNSRKTRPCRSRTCRQA